MRDLEEGRNAEGFGELGAQAREAQVIEEHIALNLPCDALNCARVGQAQCVPPLTECCIYA